MPASERAAIFSAAVPFPPAMIAPAWPMRRPGRCLSRNESYDRFGDISFRKRRGFFFRRAANLADHHDAFCLRIFLKQLQGVDVCCPDDRIAADAHGG